MSMPISTTQGVLGASSSSKKRQSVSSIQSIAHKKPRLHPLRQTSYPDGDAGLRTVNTSKAADVDGASITDSFTGSFTGSQFSKRRKSKKDRDGTVSVKGGGSGEKNAGGDGAKSTRRGASIAEEAEDDGEGNDEEEDIEDDVGLFAKDEAAVDDSEAEKKNLAILVDAFTPEQSLRYDFFKRAKLNKPMVRKIVNQTLSQSVPPNVITTISGYTKVFVGELIERARTVQEEWAEVEDRAAIERIMKERAEKTQTKKARKRSSSKGSEESGGNKTADASHNATNSENEKEETQEKPTAASPTDESMADADERSIASDSSEDDPEDPDSIPPHKLPPNPHRGPLLPQHIREALRRYKHDNEGGGVGFSGLSMGSLGVKGSYVWGQGGGGRRLFR